MMKRAFLIVLTWLLAGSGLALAQEQPVPPDHYTLDERGVDLVRGTFSHVAAEVVIGRPGDGGIIYGRAYTGDGWRDLLSGTISISGSAYTVSLGAESEVFIKSGSTFTPVSNNGSTLTQSGYEYTFTSAAGTVARFSGLWSGSSNPWTASEALVEWIRRPSGEQLTFNYLALTYCGDLFPPDPPEDCTWWRNAVRLQSVGNNRGYQVNFTYAMDVPQAGFVQVWYHRTSATGVNLAVDWCGPFALSCTGLTQTWPSVTYPAFPGTNPQTVTDQSGRVTTYTHGTGGLTGIRYPGSSSDDVTITYSSGRVASVTTAGSTWSYGYGDVGATRTATTTNPGTPASTTAAVSNQTIGRLTAFTDELSRTTAYQYDGQRRLERATHPEGNYTQYAYDGRGNVTEVRHVAKSGSGLADIVTTAAYPGSCTNPLTCNQPTSITDPRGNTTTFTYDSAHGGVLTITQPAPTGGAAQPQTRITYGAHYAWYKNSAGTIVQAPTAVTLPTAISACVTGTSCADAAGEVRTTFTYGSTGVANNLLPTTVTDRDGTGSLSATTTLTYTHSGDVASVNGPLSGSDDTTYYRYDAARQLIGVIGPDPDGAGPLLRRAQRNTYDLRGQVTLSEQGTVTGLTDPDWAAFTTLQRQAVEYDAYGRPTHARAQAAGGATHALSQVSYDARSRVDCVATRMNPATFGSPPGSACTLATAGTFGPDRVVRYGYDLASQIIEMTSGYGSGDAIAQQFTYTNNGRLLTAQDGDGNLSTWVYDGFDRVHRLRFPTTAGGTSSTTDYEEYTYDANSNVVTYRTRAAQTFTATYDALNRRILLTTPGAMANITYVYDNLGRPTSISQPGHAQTYAWDALGRLTSQTGPLGTFAMQYDLAGRRTRITWPDAFYAQYDWNLYNQVTAVRENGASSGAGVLAQYAYDNLGRRTGITRGNGVPTAYGYDAISRVTSIAHDLTGATYDVTLTMAYNPAGQITSRTISNNLYAYAPANQSTAYTINGRNEITAAGGTSFTYDANRNLTNDGTAFTYDAANRLLTAGSHDYSYAPSGELFDVNSRRLAHVDGQPVSLHTTSSGNVYRRFVPGPGINETVGYYVGAGTSDKRWTIQDHLNSNIGYPDASGAPTTINTFDEYGNAGPGNSTYLQFAGQFTPTVASGVLYARNRFYRPSIGRFMQTDPIGYGDGLNMWAYVGNDPVNAVDPWGLQRQGGQTCINTVRYTIDRQTGRILRREILGTECVPQSIADSTQNPPVSGGPPSDDDCEHRDSRGRCVYRRDDDGKLVLDAEYAIIACQNYRRMMESNREVAEVTTPITLSIAGYRIVFQTPRPVAIPFFATSATHFGLSQSPPPPGCQP